MTRSITRLIYSLLLALNLFISTALADRAPNGEQAQTGQPAPTLSLTNALGERVSLETLKGKTVVLEWFNPGCPFVKKFYKKGDMQRFQSEARELGAIWLTISSSAPGRSGYIPPEDAVATAKEHGLNPSMLLLDPEGVAGRAFGAKTTPHIFVLDPRGNLAYAGAIDDKPSTDQEDIASAENYPLKAIKAISKGAVPVPADTNSYGCSVKY